MTRRELIGRNADAGLVVALPRRHAVEPRLLGDAVRHSALTRFITQTADDRHVLADGLERLQDEGKLRVAARRRRLPLRLQRAVREVDEAEPRGGRCRGLRQSRSRRDHRVEQRQRDRSAGTLQNRTAGQMLACQKHSGTSPFLRLAYCKDA
jgi:hypothetical protein